MMKKNENPYEDMLFMEHPVSKKHPQMSLIDRAAQFSPFAALTGHSDAISETARLTDEKLSMDEDYKEIINEVLLRIDMDIQKKPYVVATYFCEDLKKAGGTYGNYSGNVKKIDRLERKIVFMDGKQIPIDDLKEIEYYVNVDGEGRKS